MGHALSEVTEMPFAPTLQTNLLGTILPPLQLLVVQHFIVYVVPCSVKLVSKQPGVHPYTVPDRLPFVVIVFFSNYCEKNSTVEIVFLFRYRPVSVHSDVVTHDVHRRSIELYSILERFNG